MPSENVEQLQGTLDLIVLRALIIAVACSVPLRRALRIEPTEALRVT